MSANDLLPVKKNKFRIWDVAYLIIILCLSICGIFLFFFVRSNIARIIANTQTINIISSNQNIDIIDMRAYNAANLAMKDKQISTVVPKNLRDIFLPVSTTTPVTPTLHDNSTTNN